MRIVMLVLAALALGGCGADMLKKYATDYNASLDAYKQCVRASGPEGCRKEQAILEVDTRRYNDAWATMNSGAPPASGYRPAVYQPVGGGTVIRY